MPIRLSALVSRTLRDDPTDAELPSDRLLQRAGYIRRVAPGLHAWLPLGLAVLANVERIVREEMLAIGAQEVRLPALVPAELVGRAGPDRDDCFRLSDRRHADYVVGPDCTELVTLLVSREVSSSRDLPVTLFEMRTRLRDERRPRAGVLRAREFLTSESFSFAFDDAGPASSYEAHRGAFERVMARLGLEHRIVRALPEAGGARAEAFLCPARPSAGALHLDAFVHCSACGYAAERSAAEIGVPAPRAGAEVDARLVETPGASTIAALVDALDEQQPERAWSAADTLKCLAVTSRAGGAGDFELLVVGVPGDRDVDLERLGGELGTEVVPATAEELASDGRLVRGYLGPQGLAEMGIRLVLDRLVAPGTSWVAGANEPGRHVLGLVAGRDFSADAVVGAVEVRDGDRCPRCAGELRVGSGIEIGRLAALRLRHRGAVPFEVPGADGKPLRVTTGSYRLGVSRAVAALAEQNHDEHGLRWPLAVGPADVHMVVARRGEEAEAAAARIAQALEADRIRVLLDDRPGLSAGARFADAELIGVPLVLTVGRGLAEGVIDVRDRWSGERSDVAVEDAPNAIREKMARLP